MTTLSNHDLNNIDLNNIDGGVTHGAPGTQSERYKEMCTVPTQDRAGAVRLDARPRDPDSSEAPGVKHRVVQAIGDLCGRSK